jgi:hypothetical protein
MVAAALSDSAAAPRVATTDAGDRAEGGRSSSARLVVAASEITRQSGPIPKRGVQCKSVFMGSRPFERAGIFWAINFLVIDFEVAAPRKRDG